jgi:hypothetical protein
MRDIGDRNAEAADAARRYADEHGVTLRPIEMDVSDQASVNRQWFYQRIGLVDLLSVSSPGSLKSTGW